MAQKFTTGITVRDLASAASDAMAISVAGDSDDRIKTEAGGKIVWGSGSATGDVNLYRDAADRLKTDDVFQAAGGVVTITTSGTPTVSLPDGALAIDTTNSLLYIRTGGVWEIASGGGASVTTSDAAPSAPEDGDLWYETDSGAMFVYYDDGVTQQWVEVGTAGVIAMATQSSPPSTPSPGDLWFDIDNGRTYLYYADNDSSQWVEIGAASAAASGVDGAIQFATGGALGSDNANLHWDDTNNRLGIGTTSPDTELHIAANSGAKIRIESTDTSLAVDESIGAIEWEAQDISTGSSGVVGKIDYLAEDVTPDYAMTFHTMKNNSGTPEFSERLRIDSSGNVGIGTTSPTGDLDINGNSSTLVFTSPSNTNRYRIDANISDAADYGFSIGYWDGAAYQRTLTVDDSGKVGVGTTAPNDMLDVGGTANAGSFRVHATGGGESFRVTGTVVRSTNIVNLTTASAANVFINTANNSIYRSTSSAKYKTDIETLGDEYADIVFELRPVWYRSTTGNDPEEYSYYGLIAEEVAQVDPRLVHFGATADCGCVEDEDGHIEHEQSCLTEPEGVFYERLVPHLINVVQRQQEQIDALTARIEALEAN